MHFRAKGTTSSDIFKEQLVLETLPVHVHPLAHLLLKPILKLYAATAKTNECASYSLPAIKKAPAVACTCHHQTRISPNFSMRHVVNARFPCAIPLPFN